MDLPSRDHLVQEGFELRFETVEGHGVVSVGEGAESESIAAGSTPLLPRRVFVPSGQDEMPRAGLPAEITAVRSSRRWTGRDPLFGNRKTDPTPRSAGPGPTELLGHQTCAGPCRRVADRTLAMVSPFVWMAPELMTNRTRSRLRPLDPSAGTETGGIRWSRVGMLVVGVLFLGSALSITLAFRSTQEADRKRVEGRATIVTSPWGPLEYLEGGNADDPPVILIHGGGGGYDQGELMAEILLSEGFRWIAPSRFGYLGSSLPPGGTPDQQAHAFAWLLDELGVEQVGVVALSAGGPSGLLLTLLHPERVTSLTLLSAGVTRVGLPEQASADWKGRMLVRLFSHDFPYWAVTSLLEGRFIELMGADREVIAGFTPEQRVWVSRLIESMRPASLRSGGARFDNRAPLPGERIAGIRAPTLVIHAEDDRLQLFENARFAEATIPGARLLRFGRGGHLVMITEVPTGREAIRSHLLDHGERR
ncbi:MAG: alpha/beta hydrolase [Gemmatimonadales bacterium]|nr:MAG: alpha/beta hydrolase [Gemmatimonadales bacterium]